MLLFLNNHKVRSTVSGFHLILLKLLGSFGFECEGTLVGEKEQATVKAESWILVWLESINSLEQEDQPGQRIWFFPTSWQIVPSRVLCPCPYLLLEIEVPHLCIFCSL